MKNVLRPDVASNEGVYTKSRALSTDFFHTLKTNALAQQEKLTQQFAIF